MGHWHIFAPAPEPQAPSSASLAIHVHPAATTSEEEQATEQAHERAGHCPSGPSRCSSAPAVPVIPFTEAGVVVLVLGAGLLMLLERSTISALDRDVLPLRRPPRRTLSPVLA